MTQIPPPPTTPPGAAAGPEVTALEKKLADAAAQVAKVQAELSQARAADPNLPDVPVPYAGNAPVVMINGQQLPEVQAVDISAMLGGVMNPSTPAMMRIGAKAVSSSTLRGFFIGVGARMSVW